MITPAHVQTLARYNRWQNRSIYGAADRLPDAERKRARGAFFESIHGTLSHLYFGDQIWMHRFTGTTPLPIATTIAESVTAMPDWVELKTARAAFDEVIVAWADAMSAADLEGDLAWHSGALGREVRRPRWLLVTHMFNHQTHHRGQVHCLLTQNGLKMADTDLPFGPE
jgi:uncharacterized damage-inducible protein DinB